MTKTGRYELPAHARGVLVLADPPEAGWRLELPPDEEVAPEAEQAAGTQAIKPHRRMHPVATRSR